MKTVILVGGTSYSGSTLLEMILANDERAFSCGEVMALFQPTKPHHIAPMCGCGDPACAIWKDASVAGESNFISHLFQTRPDINTIVTSSKSVFWIREQSKILKRQGFNVRNVLIWKSPLQFAYSMHRRGRYSDWEHAWISYHKTYLNFIHEFIGVPYSSLVSDERELLTLCGNLGLHFFPEKRFYWNKKQHALFGNTVTKYHQHASGSDVFKDHSESLSSAYQVDKPELLNTYKTIYSVQVPPDFERTFSFERTIEIQSIERCLNTTSLIPALRFNWIHRMKLLLGYRFKKFQRKNRLVILR